MVDPRQIDERSQALLAAIVDFSDDAIISKDLNGVITSWNKAAERIFGYTAEEAIGRPVTMLMPPDRVDEEPEILRRIRNGERIRHYETIRRAKDGSLLNISLSVSPIVDSKGKIIGASKIARDITKEKSARERLRRSEEQLRVTLGSIGDGVIATDREGRITFMNPVAETLTGWKAQEAMGNPLSQVFRIVNEFTREEVENPVTKVLREGGIVGLANHTVLIAKDGTERPIDDSGAPILNSSAGLLGVVLVFRDVSERRKAELTSLRLAAIVENSDDAIISKDLNGVITSWNRGAQGIFGHSAAEMVGRSIMAIIPPELRREEEQILARLRRGERVDHFETVRVAKDGRHVPVSLTISPIKDVEGRIVGASKIARDISGRKEIERVAVELKEKFRTYAEDLERQVRERTGQLERTVAELEAFWYSLSHDMRAPLRAITSFSQIVLGDYGDKIGKEGQELLGRTVSAARRMDDLIVDLLAFTRLSREPMKTGPVNVEKLIRAIVAERLEFQPPRADIDVASPLMNVIGHESSLTQCITNLLDNAIKFMAPGVKPKVRVYSERKGDQVRLWFKDNGIGIDEGGQRQLFQMFQRIHADVYPGTGIGLAIVRKAVERMGGEAGVESEPGKGSKFWLQLPGTTP